MPKERAYPDKDLKTDRVLTPGEVAAGEMEEAGLGSEFKKKIELGELVKDEKFDEGSGKRFGVMLKKPKGGSGKDEIVYWQDDRLEKIQEEERKKEQRRLESKYESEWEKALFGEVLDEVLENYEGPEQ